jgi:DNA-binding NarL/FixJ family response regulator
MNNVKYKKKVAKATILIVEDHDALRDSLRRWLSSVFPDCIFFEASTGEEAVAHASAYVPDIILMDIGLPKMSGIEATRQIRNAVPETNVVMLTIHDFTDYRNDSIDVGAVAFISKHMMHKELIPTLEKLLSHPVDTSLDSHPSKRKDNGKLS